MSVRKLVVPLNLKGKPASCMSMAASGGPRSLTHGPAPLFSPSWTFVPGQPPPPPQETAVRGCASPGRPRRSPGRLVRPSGAPPAESLHQRVWAAGLRVGHLPAGDAAGLGAKVPASARDADPHLHRGAWPLTLPHWALSPDFAKGAREGPPLPQPAFQRALRPQPFSVPWSSDTFALSLHVASVLGWRVLSEPHRHCDGRALGLAHLLSVSLSGPQRTCSPVQRLHVGGPQWTPSKWTHHRVGLGWGSPGLEPSSTEPL